MNTLNPAALLPPADLPAPPEPPPVVLSWRAAADPPTPLADRNGTESGWVPLGQFASWLYQAKVLDPASIELPGATVLLPYGMALMRRFEAIVREEYEYEGYDEYDFPLVVPPTAVDPSRAVMSLDNALMFAGNDEDWKAGRHRVMLSPTGESSVYTYWARRVRRDSDLPQRMYRRARYFRPARPGRSLLRGIESGDVFEFQACHRDAPTNTAAFARAVEMCARVCARMHVPVLISTRPPWTNNAAVADICVGVDVPLPHGATLQVGCIYDQGDRFSRYYDVAWREAGQRWHTRHVAGCVTRRLLLAHLFLGMDTAGELLVHPDLAPVQVVGVVHGHDAELAGLADELAAVLRDRGIRAVVEASVGARHRFWRRQGVPVCLHLHPSTEDGAARAVLVRADTRQECSLPVAPVTQLADRLGLALREVAYGYADRAHRFVTAQCQPATAQTVQHTVRSRRVAVCPLMPTDDVVRAVADWRIGEVIGFRRASRPSSCVVSGQHTDAEAYISPRT